MLFLVRSGVGEHGTPAMLARALPSALVLGVAWRLSPDGTWPWWALAVTALGALVTIASLGTLGRSFAILPARRGLVSRGPYAVVRHPAYLGELVIAAGVGSASGAGVAALVALVLALLLVPRILDEERLLENDGAYATYRERVRYRLVPGIW